MVWDMVKGKEQLRLEIWHIAASLSVEPHPAVGFPPSNSPFTTNSRIMYQSITTYLLIHEEVLCVMCLVKRMCGFIILKMICEFPTPPLSCMLNSP